MWEEISKRKNELLSKKEIRNAEHSLTRKIQLVNFGKREILKYENLLFRKFGIENYKIWN